MFSLIRLHSRRQVLSFVSVIKAVRVSVVGSKLIKRSRRKIGGLLPTPLGRHFLNRSRLNVGPQVALRPELLRFFIGNPARTHNPTKRLVSGQSMPRAEG